MSLRAAVALSCLALLACSGGRPDPATLDGLHPRSAEGLRIVFADYEAEPEISLRGILHSADGGAVEQDIDMGASGGVADFGALDRDTAAVSLVFSYPDGSYALTLWDLPVREYRLGAFDPDCGRLVEVDVTVDASATPGGASDGASASAFGYSIWYGWSSPPSSSWDFPGLRACGDQPARVLATTYVDGDPSLYALDSYPGFADGESLTIQPDRPMQSATWVDGNTAPAVVGLETWVDGQPVGIDDFLFPSATDTTLYGAFDIAGAQVLTWGIADNDGTQIVRETALAAPSAEVSLDFWPVTMAAGEYDAERSAQTFHYESELPAQLALAGFYSQPDPDTGQGGAYWLIVADATRGELIAPAMPEDIERRMRRETHATQDAAVEIQRYDAFTGYADWAKVFLGSDTPSWELDKSIAYESPPLEPPAGGSLICLPLLIGGELCIGNATAARPATRRLDQRPWQRHPPLFQSHR